MILVERHIAVDLAVGTGRAEARRNRLVGLEVVRPVRRQSGDRLGIAAVAERPVLAAHLVHRSWPLEHQLDLARPRVWMRDP